MKIEIKSEHGPAFADRPGDVLDAPNTAGFNRHVVGHKEKVRQMNIGLKSLTEGE